MAVAAIVYGRAAAVPNATMISTASDPNNWDRTADGAPDSRYRLATAISSVRLRPTASTNDHTKIPHPAKNRVRLTAKPNHASGSGATTPRTVAHTKALVPAYGA